MLRANDPDTLHRHLASLNRRRFSPTVDDALDLETEVTLRRLETDFIEQERARVRAQAEAAPRDADGFVRYFESMKSWGPGQDDALFPWLERDATMAEMRWFLGQEIAGEAGFDDLVALTQVKMPPRVKLELARNYWDEMGQGNEGGMHGPMLDRLADALDLDAGRAPAVWEALALGNVMSALAANRRWAYHAIGALGVIELTAPGRAAKVNAGLKRLGVPGEARRYFALHATLDVKHSEAWNREVLHPLVAADPRLAVPIAEGALLRLTAGARCFTRYRTELWPSQSRAIA